VGVQETVLAVPDTAPDQVYVYGGEPPDGFAVKLALWPTLTGLGVAPEVTDSGGGAVVAVNVKAFVVESWVTVSVTRMEKLRVPTKFGVPDSVGDAQLRTVGTVPTKANAYDPEPP
jgi:hypothetical protein